jgi:hypothetical protein
VIESLHEHEILSSDISKQFERKLTFGERLSDHIAEFGGSWRFIITFGAVLVGWIILNTAFLLNRGFDPYLFILLHCAFYPGSALKGLKNDLKGYDTSKGTVRFSPDKPLPPALVRKIVNRRIAEQVRRKN